METPIAALPRTTPDFDGSKRFSISAGSFGNHSDLEYTLIGL